MAAGAPLIPEGAAGAGALISAFVGLLALVGYVVCIGILWAYRHTIGALTATLVQALRHDVPIVGRLFAWPLEKIDNSVQHALSVGAEQLEVASGRFFHASGVILGWMVNFMLATVNTTERAFGWMIHVHLPRWAKWTIRAAFPLGWLTKVIAEQIAKLIPHAKKIAKAVAHDATTVVYRYPKALERRIARDELHIKRIAAGLEALGGSIAIPLPIDTPAVNWRGLTRKLARLERRLHRVEGLFAAGVLAVAMANVLGVTARCLRRGNVGRTARALCGMPTKLLDDLLGLIADVWILENVCVLIPLLEESASAIAVPLVDALTVVGAGLCKGVSKPGALQGPSVTTPAVIFDGFAVPAL